MENNTIGVYQFTNNVQSFRDVITVCILASGILSFPKQGTALADISQSIFYFIELSRGLYVGNIYLGLSRN